MFGSIKVARQWPLIELSEQGGGDSAIRMGGARNPVDASNNGLALFGKVGCRWCCIERNVVNGEATAVWSFHGVGIREPKSID